MTWLESEYDLDDVRTVAAIDETPIWSAPFGVRLLEVVKFRRGLRALDVGSGLGFPLTELAQRLGPTCAVCGLDPWAAGNARAREKIAVWGLENAGLVAGVAEQMPFPDAAFDLIVSNNGTNNVADEDRAFAEIARVAKPGAQIVLTMNLPGTMIEFYDVYRDVLRRRDKRVEIDRIDEHIHRKRKPLAHVRALLGEVGLELSDLHEHAFKLRYTDGSAMLASPMIKVAFLASWTGLLEADDVAPIFGAVEDELNRVARTAGGLTLTVPWVCLDARRLD